MAAGGAAGATAAAAAAAANAIKASGVVVRVEPADFAAILARMESPLVVVSQGGIVRKHFRYLTSYKGLAFFTKSSQAFVLPRRAEVISAGKISIPDI